MEDFDIGSSLLMLIFNIFGISCSIIFIIIVVFHRQCYTMNILLVLNSTIAGLICNLVCGNQAIYQLIGDGNDRLCILRGYLLYSSTGLLYHTLCVQGLQRFFVVVLATRRRLQSKQVIFIIVIVQWLISSTFILPILLTKRIKYNPGSRICLISINDPFAFLYLGTCVYFFTMTMIILLYIMIVRHMKLHLFITNVPRKRAERRRQRREIRLYCRILLLVSVLFLMGVPYCVFFSISMINGAAPAPPYADRISFLSISMGYSASMLLSLLYTDDVRQILIRSICGEPQNRRRHRGKDADTSLKRSTKTSHV